MCGYVFVLHISAFDFFGMCDLIAICFGIGMAIGNINKTELLNKTATLIYRRFNEYFVYDFFFFLNLNKFYSFLFECMKRWKTITMVEIYFRTFLFSKERKMVKSAHTMEDCNFSQCPCVEELKLHLQTNQHVLILTLVYYYEWSLSFVQSEKRIIR